MHDTLRFWLDRGVDGFRMDVIHAIGKDPATCPTTRPRLPADRPRHLNDVPATHELLRASARCSTRYPGDRVMVGEVYLLDTARWPTTTATTTSCTSRSTSRRCARRGTPSRGASGIDAGPSTSSSPRARGRRGCCPTTTTRATAPATASEARARAAAVLLLTLRGTPFLYAGRGARPRGRGRPSPIGSSIPGGRDGCRAPIPWTRGAAARLGAREPWLPWPPPPTTGRPRR